MTITERAPRPSEQDSNEELRQRLAQQSAIAEFGRLALIRRDMDELLHAACRVAALGLGSPLAKALEKRSGETGLFVRAGVGWRPGVVGTATVGDDLESPAGFAFRTGEPVISNHLAQEKRFRTPAIMAEHGVKRAINVLIRTDSEPFGVLEVDSRELGAFCPNDVDFLEALAGMLGVALERHAAEQALQAALADKDLLIREVDHRVKNSLAMVGGLLSMQERAATSSEAKQALGEASTRLMTIARVHEQLYKSADLHTVRIDDYLMNVCDDISRSVGREDVRVEVEADRVDLASDKAVPLGLITAELVTNALKHAGQGSTASVVHVAFGRGDPGLRLLVRDHGPGLPPGFDPAKSNGLGMRLVRTLGRSLRGKLTVADAKPGACFSLAFPPATVGG